MAGRAYEPSQRGKIVLQEFGELLRSARIRKNLTQAELAKLLGINRMTLVRVEEGKASASWGVIVDLCLVLDMPLYREVLPEELKKELNEISRTKRRAGHREE